MKLASLLLFLILFPSFLFAQRPAEIKIENNVTMKTRDGVTLNADIYRPRAEGKYPVILERTSYDKRTGVSFGLKAAGQGYVYIIQDIRGRYVSGGDWYPFKYEGQDGYDTVEWAASLPYSNGKVGLWGGSYVGATQMLCAIASPPHLAGIMPVVTASNYYHHWAYQGGAFMQLLAQAWSSVLAIDTLQRRIGGSALPTLRDMKIPAAEYQLFELGNLNGLADYYFDWIAHPTYDEYWKQWAIEEDYSRIKVPGLHVAAWYDLFQDGSLRNYIGIKAFGGTEEARKGQRLVIIPGGHAGFGEKIADVDFGKESTLDTWALGLKWYDYLLKGQENEFSRQKPVKVFVMGKNKMREEDDWPLARAKLTSYFLHSAGGANSAAGDGVLSRIEPRSEKADTFVYDPADPVPTNGGGTLGDTTRFPPGPIDQRKIEERKDILVYTTPAFEKDVEVTGKITLEVYLSSSAVDTDLTGKLIDVWPDGFAQNLTDNILRLRYRNGFEKAEFMKPGSVYKVQLDLWSTSNVFLAGHKLRLEVSSSNFPRFNRNLNTAENPEKSKAFVKATNIIYHDRNRPSALKLPIIE